MANKKQVVDEEYELKELNLSRALRVLCLLSSVGFAGSLIIDFSYFTGLQAFVDDGFAGNDAAAYSFQSIIVSMDFSGMATDKESLGRVSDLFLYLGILNIPVMLGVALMFFRVKAGFYLYALFQGLYILLPVYFVGFGFYSVFRASGVFDAIIMTLFIIMYGIQSKNLGNPKIEAK